MNVLRFLRVFLFALVIFLPCFAYGQEANRITITIGFTNKPSGDKCEGSKGICFIIHFDRDPARKGKGVLGEASVEGGKLRINFKKPLPGKGSPKKRTEPITIFEDMPLDESTAAALGYKSIIIKKGDYPGDYTSEKYGKFGSTIFETTMEK